MNSKFIKKGIIIAAFASVILVPAGQTLAAEASNLLSMSKQNNEVSFSQNSLMDTIAEINEVALEAEIKIESAEEIQMKENLSGKAFATVGAEGYVVIYKEADETSEAAGKVFADSVVKVIAKGDAWTEVTSGNIVGFIKNEQLISGKAAIERGKAILAEKYPETDIYTLNKEAIEEGFTVGETTEEEAQRLAAEEAQRIAEEEARIAAEQAERVRQGQDVVDFAKQFIGNPYVYGGESLTRGTDCSGFVRSVYKNFGIYLPRSSYYMRSVGYEVSYDEIQPGDIVCYSGHVGIYAGNGQIVNAIDESRGIGMSNARYAKILTIRRMF